MVSRLNQETATVFLEARPLLLLEVGLVSGVVSLEVAATGLNEGVIGVSVQRSRRLLFIKRVQQQVLARRIVVDSLLNGLEVLDLRLAWK